ncbi:hypothetical protein HZ326_23437, partial [Fusarium oxysporum f. sp. albedinis]
EYTYPHMYTHLCLLHDGYYSHDRWCEGHVILGAPSVVQVWLPTFRLGGYQPVAYGAL